MEGGYFPSDLIGFAHNARIIPGNFMKNQKRAILSPKQCLTVIECKALLFDVG